MGNYVITYHENLIHTFHYEADSKEEAMKRFNHDLNHGIVDFSNAYLNDSKITIEEERK